MSQKMNFDPVDRKILNLIQQKFPYAERPYQVFGEELSLSEEEVLGRVACLKEMGVIRQLSAIFDTRLLGYQSALVAMAFFPEKLEAGAAVISSHPGVSHNYQRNNHFNLWFTLAVPPHGDLAGTVALMAERAQAETTRILPTLKLYKIGVNLDVVGDRPPDEKEESSRKRPDNKREMTERDIVFICALQEDLPIIPRPYDKIAEQLGTTLPELFNVARQFEEEGLMRRFSAVLRHQQAGFSANGMAVWVVPEERIDEVGHQMAAFKAVSHCYRRPVYPDWPYNVFTMIHGRTQEDCEKIARLIQAEVGVERYQILYSTKEYKKERVKYFVEEEWIQSRPATKGVIEAFVP